jgi:hypothetical protein
MPASSTAMIAKSVMNSCAAATPRSRWMASAKNARVV